MLNKIKSIIDSNGHGNIHYKKWDVSFRDEYFSKVYWSYFPMTQKYYFEGNPSFSYEYKDLFDLSRYPIITLRDGFAGILDFFLMHPTPGKDFRSILLINKKFENLVPKQWAEWVACYSIQPIKKNVNDKKNNLIIHGLGVEDNFWIKTPVELAKEIKKISSEFKNTTFLIPQRESLMSTPNQQDKRFDIQFLKALYEVFGFDIEMEMITGDFLEDFKERDFSFYNIDQNNAFIADNYIDHYFYSAGGKNLNTHSETSDSPLEYNLSHNHKIVIEEIDFSKNIFSKFYLPHKVSGRKNISMYDVYQSELFQKIFKESFS